MQYILRTDLCFLTGFYQRKHQRRNAAKPRSWQIKSNQGLFVTEPLLCIFSYCSGYKLAWRNIAGWEGTAHCEVPDQTLWQRTLEKMRASKL